MNEIVEASLYYLAVGLTSYFSVTLVLASALAMVQESKIWQPKSVPSLSVIGCLKVFLFNVMWMTLCFIGSVLIIVKWILSLGTSDIAREGNRWVENFVGKACTRCFVGNVRVEGMENIPANAEGSIPAPIFIANHASQIDIGAVYYIEQRFKWIAKQSVIYLPGVGSLMLLSRHVLIDRNTGKNKSSVSNLFEKSNAAVQSGIPMLLFPQGTRRIAEKLPFKNGAFVVAQTNRSPLIPMSIDVPLDGWNSLYPLNLLWGGHVPTVKITVHKSIPVTGQENREALKEKCMAQIYSVLPDIGSEPQKDK